MGTAVRDQGTVEVATRIVGWRMDVRVGLGVVGDCMAGVSVICEEAGGRDVGVVFFWNCCILEGVKHWGIGTMRDGVGGAEHFAGNCLFHLRK